MRYKVVSISTKDNRCLFRVKIKKYNRWVFLSENDGFVNTKLYSNISEAESAIKRHKEYLKFNKNLLT